MLKCNKFVTLDERLNRCKELKLCGKCTSSKHELKDCLGNENKLTFKCSICSEFSHISAMCTKNKTLASNICINSGMLGNLFLLPIIGLTVKYRNISYTFNCLFDSGSQRSYFAQDVIDNLNCGESRMTPVVFDVKTFITSQIKSLKETTLEIKVSHDRFLTLPILVDDSFNINFQIEEFPLVLSNLKQLNLKLSADFDNSEFIKVKGLIGVDLIQFLQPINIVDCMCGSAFSLYNGISPFGNILNFLHYSQVKPVSYKKNK